jgi:hypothetical protein
MLISPALAGHGVADTGSSGGGIALLVILAVVIMLAFGYMAQKKWRRRMQGRDRTGK